jgi:hypothetical protein
MKKALSLFLRRRGLIYYGRGGLHCLPFFTAMLFFFAVKLFHLTFLLQHWISSSAAAAAAAAAAVTTCLVGGQMPF